MRIKVRGPACDTAIVILRLGSVVPLEFEPIRPARCEIRDLLDLTAGADDYGITGQDGALFGRFDRREAAGTRRRTLCGPLWTYVTRNGVIAQKPTHVDVACIADPNPILVRRKDVNQHRPIKKFVDVFAITFACNLDAWAGALRRNTAGTYVFTGGVYGHTCPVGRGSRLGG
jgi:hypothetical protein